MAACRLVGVVDTDLDYMLQSVRIPKRFEATNPRYLMDVALMLVMRARNFEHRYVRYLQIDSSPQAGRDYLNIIICSIVRIRLPELFEMARRLLTLPIDVESIDEDRLDLHEKLQAALAAELQIHRCPSVLLGFGFSSTAHKLVATAWSMRLEASSHHEVQGGD